MSEKRAIMKNRRYTNEGRICSGCKDFIEWFKDGVQQFGTNSASRTGYGTYCRECDKDRQKGNYIKKKNTDEQVVAIIKRKMKDVKKKPAVEKRYCNAKTSRTTHKSGGHTAYYFSGARTSF